LGKRIVTPSAFGMPLNPDGKSLARMLHGLDDSVPRPRGDRYPRGEIFDGLVVLAIDPDFTLSDDLMQAAAGLDLDGMGVDGLVQFGRVAEALRHLGGNVLEESSTESDIQHLDAAADAKNRQVFIDGQSGGHEFHAIERLVHFANPARGSSP